MPAFHETGYGQRFFVGQLPRLIAALESIAASLKTSATQAEASAAQSAASATLAAVRQHVEQLHARPDGKGRGAARETWDVGFNDAVAEVLGILDAMGEKS